MVSSIGAAEAMPALETQMSRPPKRHAASAKSAAMEPSSVTSPQTPTQLSLPNCD